MTLEAKQAVETADVVVGYKTYVKLIESIIKPGVEVFSGVMGKEVERAKVAVAKALEGKHVVVISSGDPGVYGMAGVVLEVVDLENARIPVEVIPGVTAATVGSRKARSAVGQRLLCHKPQRPPDAMGLDRAATTRSG